MLLKRLTSSKKIWIEKKLAGVSNIPGLLKKPAGQTKPSKDKEKPSAPSTHNSQKGNNTKATKS